MRFDLKKMLAVAAVVLFGAVSCVSARTASDSSRPASAAAEAELSQKVYRHLMDLPFFTVFDNIQYRVEGTEVTLYGETANETLSIDAEKFVTSIPNVTKVNNQIELLPVGRFDNAIRHAAFRAIYTEPALQKYGEGSYPSIHIIVKNSRVRLVGTVDNELDKRLAGIRAGHVRNVFSVENELKIRTTP